MSTSHVRAMLSFIGIKNTDFITMIFLLAALIKVLWFGFLIPNHVVAK